MVLSSPDGMSFPHSAPVGVCPSSQNTLKEPAGGLWGILNEKISRVQYRTIVRYGSFSSSSTEDPVLWNQYRWTRYVSIYRVRLAGMGGNRGTTTTASPPPRRSPYESIIGSRRRLSVLLTAAATAVVCLTVRINILAMRRRGLDGAAGDVVRDGGFRRTLERSVVASSPKKRRPSGIPNEDEDEETKPNNDLDAATESDDEEETEIIRSSTSRESQRHNPPHDEHGIPADQGEWTCDAQGAPDFLPDRDFTRRALHAVIIGAMKGGTQALMETILSHRRMLPAGKGHGELHFFSTRGMMKNLMEFRHKPDRHDRVIRRRYLREGFEWVLRDREFRPEYDLASDANGDKLGVHSAPIYLFSGRGTAARLLCAAPWSKVIAILRNPIDRAFSHYNFVHDHLHGDALEEFIHKDIRLLKKTGVLRDWASTDDFESFSGSDEEFAAWETYLRRWDRLGPPGISGPVGRGLYAIQIEIWIDEMNKINKTIDDDLLVLRSEDLRNDGVGVYHRVARFLGLGRRSAKRHVVEGEHHVTDYVHDGMPEEMHRSLHELYRPYNKRLYKLLGEDDWGGVWDEWTHVKPRATFRRVG